MFHIKQKDKRKYFGDIFLSLLLILLMGGCYVVTTHVLWKMTLYDCYEEMEKATDAASASLYHFLEMDRENLELIAGVLAYERNGVKDRIKERLSAFSDHQYIDALCVQFKDGTLITDGGRLPDYSSLPSFDEMTDNLPYISGRFPGNEETETWFLYQAVPVSFEGGTQAVLYGFTDLKSFPERFSANLPYGGKSQLYLVDADTGDFLMDMWHDSLGNLYDGSMKTRKPMEGYDPDIMLNDIRSGRSGYYVFLSNTKNEYLYTRYQPAGINNWSIQLSVPEQVAFYKVGEMNGTIFVMGAAATVIALLYICVIFWKNRKRLKEKQMQIRQSSFMFEVQQILFESHHMPDLMVDALQRVAETVEAEGVILLSSVNNQIGSRAAWYRKDTDFQAIVLERNLKKDFPTAYQYLMKNQCILYYADKADTFFSEEERKTLEIFGIRSLMLVSVMDKEGLKGVLCAINLERRWNDCSYLDCVAHSFMMAMRNIDSYQIIRDMGAIDTLTGMKNRNSYEKELPDYAGAEYETLHCIYIDVNDLHGINNRYGHEEGDRMLRCVADAIREGFGREHAYRIGGDEFVIFSSEKENFLTGRLERMRRFVESKGYFISIGISGQKGGQINLEKLIAEAEAEMYREKKTYYQRHDRRKKPRRNEPESVL